MTTPINYHALAAPFPPDEIEWWAPATPTIEPQTPEGVARELVLHARAKGRACSPTLGLEVEWDGRRFTVRSTTTTTHRHTFQAEARIARALDR